MSALVFALQEKNDLLREKVLFLEDKLVRNIEKTSEHSSSSFPNLSTRLSAVRSGEGDKSHDGIHAEIHTVTNTRKSYKYRKAAQCS